MALHLSSRPDGSGLRVAVLVARWHTDWVDALRDVALETLQAHGVADADIQVVEVPGAYELPQAAGWIAHGGHADAIVALGCILRGETPHFDVVARACTDGLMAVALDSGIPVGLGVITADTPDQAAARAQRREDEDVGTKGGNKGREAADAALRMAALRRDLDASASDPTGFTAP